MRAKLVAEKVTDGYVLKAILPNGEVGYPQEKYLHATKESVWNDAWRMYRADDWDYNPRNRTILLDCK